jgi:hypothetical protein
MMQRLNIDLVKSNVPVWPGMLILAIAIVAALYGYGQYLAVSERNAILDSELAQADMANQKKNAGNQPSAISSAELEAEGRHAREVSSLLLLPWGELFSALESASHNDVALLAIEPDHKRQLVHITAEAKNFDALISYLKRLDNAPQLKFVRLLRYEVRGDDPQHPMRFTVEASWRLSS